MLKMADPIVFMILLHAATIGLVIAGRIEDVNGSIHDVIIDIFPIHVLAQLKNAQNVSILIYFIFIFYFLTNLYILMIEYYIIINDIFKYFVFSAWRTAYLSCPYRS